MSEKLLTKAYRLADDVEISKLTVLVQDTSIEDGCINPAAANADGVLGIAQVSVVPQGIADYQDGEYVITSGTAWPAGAVPTSPIGRHVPVVVEGITSARAAAAIDRGAYCNIADSEGRIKAIDENAGTTVHQVCQALEAAGAEDDVIRVRMCIADFVL